MASVARDLGVGWRTVMPAVRDYGEPLVDDPARTEGVEAMGLDETAFQRASALRTTSYLTGFVDLARGASSGTSTLAVGHRPWSQRQEGVPVVVARSHSANNGTGATYL